MGYRFKNVCLPSNALHICSKVSPIMLGGICFQACLWANSHYNEHVATQRTLGWKFTGGFMPGTQHPEAI